MNQALLSDLIRDTRLRSACFALCSPSDWPERSQVAFCGATAARMGMRSADAYLANQFDDFTLQTNRKIHRKRLREVDGCMRLRV